ncbi:MAG TPA: tetratricopeptide repeat protein, partial [Opitutaceae bacterium]
MSMRRIIPWVLACAVGAAGAAIVLTRGHSRADLPSPANYPTLPAAFARALQDARERAGARGADPGEVRKLALLYQANRLFPEARACYQIVKAGPEGLSARDHYCLAAIAQDESDMELAEKELRATLLAEPGYAPARLALAQVLFKTGQSDGAKAEFEKVVRDDPQNPEADLGLARIELQEGKDEEAMARLSRMVARHPESASGAALLAQVLERKGKTAEAAAMVARSQQVHEAVPPDPWRKVLLADCYDLQTLELAFEEYRLAGQLDEALPLLERIEELDPNGWIPP